MKNQVKALLGNAFTGVTNTTGILVGAKAAIMAGMLDGRLGLTNLTYMAGLVFCAYKAGDSLGKAVLHPVRDFEQVTETHQNYTHIGYIAGMVASFAVMMQVFAAMEPAPARPEASAALHTVVPPAARAPAIQPGK